MEVGASFLLIRSTPRKEVEAKRSVGFRTLFGRVLMGKSLTCTVVTTAFLFRGDLEEAHHDRKKIEQT